ncbi:MAG TPA: hypothetical protein ENN84_02610 [Candidatus Marinimicrobia bacterium]|nr:hypothetical protein [Candidatus Neomarinimicrobiota bacterium]
MINRKASAREKKRGAVSEVKVNLSDKVAREAFIKSRLDMLFSDITDAYGQTLASELRRRLEYTIKVFHEDTISLLNEMAEHNRVKMLMNDEIRQGKSLQELVPQQAETLFDEDSQALEPGYEESPEAAALIAPDNDDLPIIPSKDELFRPLSKSKSSNEGDL